MAILGVSAGSAWPINLLSKKIDYARGSSGKSVFMPSKFYHPVKKATKPSTVKANYDHIPKQFREENLKDGVKEYFEKVPEILYGLPTKQLDKLMSGDSLFKHQTEQVTPESLSCSNYDSFYGLASYESVKHSRTKTRARRYQSSEGYTRRRRSPPDFPSMLLDSRIIFLETPLYSEITELINAQLLWLYSDDPEKPVYLYLNSTGTQNMYGQAVTLEYDAYAIVDMLSFLRGKICTLNISHASGQAAMLLSLGTKGQRYAMPGAITGLYLPNAIPEGGQSTDMWLRAKELDDETDLYLKFLSKGTGKSKEELLNDLTQRKWFDVEGAIKYGLVDKIMKPEKNKDVKVYDEVGYEEQVRRTRDASIERPADAAQWR